VGAAPRPGVLVFCVPGANAGDALRHPFSGIVAPGAAATSASTTRYDHNQKLLSFNRQPYEPRFEPHPARGLWP
jgi:hypothetical protein